MGATYTGDPKRTTNTELLLGLYHSRDVAIFLPTHSSHNQGKVPHEAHRVQDEKGCWREGGEVLAAWEFEADPSRARRGELACVVMPERELLVLLLLLLLLSVLPPQLLSPTHLPPHQ